jgi:tetratricopeptide (TPR) repeat protein
MGLAASLKGNFVFWYSCCAMLVEPRRVVLASPLRRCALRRAFASSALGCCLLGVWAAGLQACGQPRSPQTLAKDADAAYVRGDVEEAIRLYEELVKIQPGSVEARTNLGVALTDAGRYKDAVAQYDEALKRAPDNPSIFLDLALAWYKQAAFDTAAVKLERLRAKHPERRQSLYLLADCYLRLGRNADAVTLLQPVYNGDPNDRAVDFALGTALIRAGLRNCLGCFRNPRSSCSWFLRTRYPRSISAGRWNSRFLSSSRR